jgi:transposase
MCDAGSMAQNVCPLVSAEDRARLEAIVADRNRAQKHVARARIILASAERLPVAAVAKRAAVGRPAVWRWQRRFAEAGGDGLLRDATRKPGKSPLGDQAVRRVVALTCAEPPGEATHWTGRAMAEHTGVSLRSVQRIWQAHDLQPHRIRTFKRSTDPEFAAKLEDIVGLYVDPPKHAVVLSVDEKSHVWMAPGSQEKS